MKLKFDFSYMSSQAIGPRGIDFFGIINDENQIERVLSGVKEQGSCWAKLPYAGETELSEILDYAKTIRDKADSFVVFGIGGSALGCLAVSHALLHLNHNSLSRAKRNGVPKLFIEDNIDPEKLSALFDIIDLKKTYFNFISKSGETLETLSQFFIIYDLLKHKLGQQDAKQRIIITTTIGNGSLYDFAVKEGFKIFDIPKEVGGRFSVFSAVGLIPLAAVGVDIKALLKGALEMGESCLNKDISQNPALMSAYLQYKSIPNGKSISVMMTYSESLKYIADFYAQLWGESLGKAVDRRGITINTGQTPVKAMGTTDQHSQIQLYCEGPFDKVITFLGVENFRTDIKIPFDNQAGNFDYLKGKDLSEVLNASREACAYALKKAGRSNFTVLLPYVNEYTIGELLAYFMYQAAFMGEFLNINAYDQPGVEEGKKAAKQLLSKGVK